MNLLVCASLAYVRHAVPHMPHARAVISRPAMVAATPLAQPKVADSNDDLMLSGLNGKAMLVEKSDIPTKAEFRKAIPKHLMQRNTAKSMMYAVISVLQSAACLAVGAMIPLKWAAAPLWLAYAAVAGTVWTGMWVVAHECGHGAFSDNRKRPIAQPR